MALKRLIYTILFSAYFVNAIAIELSIGNNYKCYSEDIVENVLFTAEINPRENDEVEVKITSNQDNENLYHNLGKQYMKTAFTTTDAGFINVCIKTINKKSQNVYLNISTGAQARDYTKIAKQKHFDPIINELNNVEDIINNYYTIQSKLLGSEVHTKTLVDATYNRVIKLAYINGCLVVGITGLVYYLLRVFFKSKKII